jgi:hypothetical protein
MTKGSNMPAKKVISLGDKYGRLTIIKEIEPRVFPKGKHRQVLCECKCGVIRPYLHSALRTGNTRSCGCLESELNIARRTTHSMTKTPEYKTYHCIKERCFSDTKYSHLYKDRGITMCHGWLEGFTSFYSDMGKRPSNKHSIDRIDVNGHYSCGNCGQCIKNGWTANCRWTTNDVQSRNRRDNVVITHGGDKFILKDWLAINNVSASAIHRIRFRYGLSPQEAIDEYIKMQNAPLKKRVRNLTYRVIEYKGQHKSIPEWARTHGIPWKTIHSRIDIGWCETCAISIPIRSGKCSHKTTLSRPQQLLA